MKKTDPTIKGASIDKLERAYDKMLAWFFAFPDKEFTLNELQKNLGISKTSANTIVGALEKSGFLAKDVLGKVWRIRVADIHHPFNTIYKIPMNLKHVYESGILEWISGNIPKAMVIVLFGSYRKGDDISTSDLDLAVEVLGESPYSIREVKIQRLGYRSDVKANIHIFSRGRINDNLFANIANGISLTGFLEVKP